jgi:hypothetical protein
MRPSGLRTTTLAFKPAVLAGAAAVGAVELAGSDADGAAELAGSDADGAAELAGSDANAAAELAGSDADGAAWVGLGVVLPPQAVTTIASAASAAKG